LHPGEPFIPAKHVEAICWLLEQVAGGAHSYPATDLAYAR
jgi:hypothetical protein